MNEKMIVEEEGIARTASVSRATDHARREMRRQHV